MSEKRYANIGGILIEVPAFCNVCQLDVSVDLRKSHFDFCSVCQKKTRHAIPFHGCPWSCTESHPDDATTCCGCGARMPQGGSEIAIAGKACNATKRVCADCDPLKDFHPTAE